jgi:hypothetical protein
MVFVFAIMSALSSLALVEKVHAASVQDFCHDPVKLVCGAPIGAREARAKRLSERIREIQYFAWDGVLKKIPDAKWDELPFDSNEAKDHEVSSNQQTLSLRQQKIANLYFGQVNQLLKKNIGGLYESFKPAYEEVRKFMIATVKARVTKDRPSDAKEMLQSLNSSNIQFIDTIEVLENPRSNQGELISQIVESCGKEGLEDNAFAVSIDGTQYLVLCPGDYLAAWDPSVKTGINLQEISGEVWTLGHEMGHHVDAHNYPNSYQKFKACIQNNYVAELAAGDPEEYMGEISADYWGTEALAGLLFNVKTEQERLLILQSALDGLCDTPDDNIHPDGRFRIENFVRRNPRLSQVLGCKADPNIAFKPSCTLRGAWKQRFW